MTQSITEYNEELEELKDLEWCHYSDMPSPYFYQTKKIDKDNNDTDRTQSTKTK